MESWVYVIMDTSESDLVKIGFSKDPELVANKLNDAEHTFMYEVAYEVLISNPRIVKKKVYEALKNFNVDNKGWFNCSVDIAIMAVTEASVDENVSDENLYIELEDDWIQNLIEWSQESRNFEFPTIRSQVLKITELDLFEKRTVYGHPNEIGNLINLKELYIDDYNYNGIPDLSRLKNLDTLDLRVGDWVNGPFCEENLKLSDDISGLINLTSLCLQGCNFDELPNIGNLVNLTDLHVAYGVGELPAFIANLTNLKKLTLCNCDFEEFPEWIGNLTNLVELDLRSCHNLYELPESVGNLVNLTTLDLMGCGNLHKLPKSINNLSNLTNLDLSYCDSIHEVFENKLNNLIDSTTVIIDELTRIKTVIENRIEQTQK